jgi:hypothetical protein
MARRFANSQMIRWAIFLALLASLFAVPTYSQSKPVNSTPTEPKPEVNQTNPESKQSPADDSKAVASPPASPEESRQAEIEADTKKLYQVAAELRAEVARTYKDSLSLTVIKKAAEVEKLAKSLKARINKEAAATKH